MTLARAPSKSAPKNNSDMPFASDISPSKWVSVNPSASNGGNPLALFDVFTVWKAGDFATH
jgi:hypothetical protein